VLDAIADLELLRDRVGLHRPGQIGGHRRLVEAFDDSLGLRLAHVGRPLRAGCRLASSSAVAVVAAALLALDLDDFLPDLRDDDVPHVSALGAKSCDICADCCAHEGGIILPKAPE
jgi:hypothetical protein